MRSEDAIAAFLQGHPQVRQGLALRLSRFIPHAPSPKQRAFLCLPHREAFYGGAAGGGKSDALLMGALQYVDVPRYSAVLFRKTQEDAFKSGAIGDRLLHWCDPWAEQGLCYWRDSKMHFYSGATVAVAGIRHSAVVYEHQSAEYQYIGFDELTQFWADEYAYLLSRLRRSRCPDHPQGYEDGCQTCLEFAALSRVPLRMRSASNPGGVGHAWVQKHFNIKPITDPVTGEVVFRGFQQDRPFVPARIEDNRYLDQTEYLASLAAMGVVDPITQQRLEKGDWTITQDARFSRKWVRYYKVQGDYYLLHTNVNTVHPVKLTDGVVFIVLDSASSEKEGPGDTSVFRKEPSYTVAGVFLLITIGPARGNLLWLDHDRHRGEAPTIITRLGSLYDRWKNRGLAFVGMEYTSQSRHLFQLLKQSGLPMKAFEPASQDKVTRSITATTRMYNGLIWFPKSGSISPQVDEWLAVVESEVFTWIGDRRQTDDQIDVLAYAAIYANRTVGVGEGPGISATHAPLAVGQLYQPQILKPP